MVTHNPSSDLASPTKPKKAWKPKPAAEGVPSMFAHATLSKPLKVNAAITSTVRRRESKEASKEVSNEESKEASKQVTKNVSRNVPPDTADTATKKPASRVSSKPKLAETKRSTAAPVVTAAKAPSTTTIEKAAAKAPKALETIRRSQTKPKRKNSNDSIKLVIGGSTTVAGIPKSWPKPHAVPAIEKPKVSKFSKKKPPEDEKEEEKVHKDIDHLIPEMYRKKSAAQLEQEQQEEIQLMRRIMWELRKVEIEREEQALRDSFKPIGGDVDATLRALELAKRQNDLADDHSSLDDSDATSKRKSAYTQHMESKLAFFHSNHSPNFNDSDSDDDDSSSISSWNSDESDGLFRG